MPKCPDCGAVALHAVGCMTWAVETGRLTPRERQVKIVERQMQLGIRRVPLNADLSSSFSHAFRVAVLVGSAHLPGDREEVIHANPADIQRLVSELANPSLPSVAGTPGSPLRFEGRRVVRDDTVPEGSLDIVPRKVDDIIGAAVSVSPSKPIVFGFDPAFGRKDAPIFSFETTNNLLPGGQPFSVIKGLS
jgi:hypothetical protein